TASAVWMPGVAFRQAVDGRVTIAPGAIAQHDIMLDSVRFATKFWPALRQEKSSLTLRMGRPLLDDICGRYGRFTTHRTLNPRPDPVALRVAVDAFNKRVAVDQTVRVARSWAGYIDMTPDLLPVLDALAAPSGLLVATGFSGHGFGLGPIAGRLVAEMATGCGVDVDLKPFQLQRFSEPATPQPVV
ncbi:MAG: FAD-binding oxidoreductase, partial [Gammaproteobacteria bacterium]|nr:FAD-binding oxidoreductase [Gammaproteobacteria bacterium]